MGIDDYLKVVDAKINAIDEVAKLESELKTWQEGEAESRKRSNEVIDGLYEQKNMEIRSAILEVCRTKGFEIDERGEIFRLSYKGKLGFTINLSETTRFISRTENGHINLSFSLKYDIPSMQENTSSINSCSSRKDELELDIKRCKNSIDFYESRVKSISLNDVDIRLEFTDNKVMKIDDVNEIISVMFS